MRDRVNGSDGTQRAELTPATRLANPPESQTAVAAARDLRQPERSGDMRMSTQIRSRAAPAQKTAMAGVRVYIRDINNRVVSDSITASDGSFYLADLKPGSYTLEVDPNTIPAGYVMLQMSKKIEIRSAADFQEITLPPIYALVDE